MYIMAKWLLTCCFSAHICLVAICKDGRLHPKTTEDVHVIYFFIVKKGGKPSILFKSQSACM